MALIWSFIVSSTYRRCYSFKLIIYDMKIVLMQSGRRNFTENGTLTLKVCSNRQHGGPVVRFLFSEKLSFESL